MKRLVILTLMGVLALGLIGCGSSEADFKGTWKGSYSESGTTAEITLFLKDDNEAMLDTQTQVLFIPAGHSQTGTWKTAGGNKCEITIDGDMTTATLSGDTLTLDLGNNKTAELTK